MADIKLLSPKIKIFEGGYENNPADAGCFNSKEENVGSNMGIAAKTFEQIFGYCPTVEDMQNITEEQFEQALEFYGKQMGFDDINNQSIAEIWFDWDWASGAYYPNMHVQELVGTVTDGSVGQHTIDAVNNYPDQESLFNQIKAARLKYVDDIIAANSSLEQFRIGWNRRIDAYSYSDNS